MCGASCIGHSATILRLWLKTSKLITLLLSFQAQVQNHGQSAGLSSQLHSRLGELQKLAQQMDSMWRMQSLRDSSSKRDIWKHKVEQVSEEYDALSAALDKHSHRERRYDTPCIASRTLRLSALCAIVCIYKHSSLSIGEVLAMTMLAMTKTKNEHRVPSIIDA